MSHRHQCEVRFVLQLRCESRQRMDDYLDLVAKRRSKSESEQLKWEARDQWFKGNRGKWGDWK